ncbi:hypothetical protein J5N97_004477 [Dioscorea zingiberensis]|uniref:AAA ATPase AAA+ lid domain-containing protein n=1 Tax=Dioscorea zingiberensis TaxID=325984 RepID=A0A9D5D6A4_9LILI|nr:hypothetical protein J5N97_004477 [Dioscorea zingiberensis]
MFPKEVLQGELCQKGRNLRKELGGTSRLHTSFEDLQEAPQGLIRRRIKLKMQTKCGEQSWRQYKGPRSYGRGKLPGVPSPCASLASISSRMMVGGFGMVVTALMAAAAAVNCRSLLGTSLQHRPCCHLFPVCCTAVVFVCMASCRGKPMHKAGVTCHNFEHFGDEVNKPSVVFIDEIDALATRYEHLVSAAYITNPSSGGKGRLDILKVHAHKVRMSPSVDLSTYAQNLPGWTGAKLAQLTQEAALVAVRNGHESILQSDMDDAVDRSDSRAKACRIELGHQGQCRRAVTEVGVTITSHLLRRYENAKVESCERISIIPRGQVLLDNKEINGDQIEFIIDSYPAETPVNLVLEEKNPGNLPDFHMEVEHDEGVILLSPINRGCIVTMDLICHLI